MPRYIDADALDKRVYEEIPLKYFNGSLKTMSFVRELIDEAPTLSPDEVRGVGEWIMAENQDADDVRAGNYSYICSNCHASDVHAKTQEVPYCWRCGAKMEVQDEQTD